MSGPGLGPGGTTQTSSRLKSFPFSFNRVTSPDGSGLPPPGTFFRGHTDRPEDTKIRSHYSSVVSPNPTPPTTVLTTLPRPSILWYADSPDSVPSPTPFTPLLRFRPLIPKARLEGRYEPSLPHVDSNQNSTSLKLPGGLVGVGVLNGHHPAVPPRIRGMDRRETLYHLRVGGARGPPLRHSEPPVCHSASLLSLGRVG